MLQGQRWLGFWGGGGEGSGGALEYIELFGTRRPVLLQLVTFPRTAKRMKSIPSVRANNDVLQ
jgi:hypothetical protein